MKKALVGINIGVLLLLVCAVAYLFGNKPKVAYVDAIKLNGEFEMRKELEKEYQKVSTSRQKLLDSLMQQLQIQAKELEVNNYPEDKTKIFEVEREKFLLKKQQYEEDNQSLINMYNQQVLTRINEYVQEFGKQNNYEFIFGATGSGSIMYANEEKDLTKEVTEFVNKKYRGE